MKTITGFVFLLGVAASAVCAAQTPATASSPASPATPVESVPPRTLPSHPDPQPAATQTAAPEKKPSSDYPGYQEVVVTGQKRYCRNDVATGSHVERNAVCLTETQMKAEQLRAQELILQTERTAAAMPASPMNVGGIMR